MGDMGALKVGAAEAVAGVVKSCTGVVGNPGLPLGEEGMMTLRPEGRFGASLISMSPLVQVSMNQKGIKEE